MVVCLHMSDIKLDYKYSTFILEWKQASISEFNDKLKLVTNSLSLSYKRTVKINERNNEH